MVDRDFRPIQRYLPLVKRMNRNLLLISVFVLFVYSIAAYTQPMQHQGFSRLFIGLCAASGAIAVICYFQGVYACISANSRYCSDARIEYFLAFIGK